MAEPFTRRLPLHPDTDPCQPLYAVWEVTLQCDQACHFCGTRAGRPRADELNTDEVLDVIRQLGEMGTREIALHGGEAYLRSDFAPSSRRSTIAASTARWSRAAAA